MVLTYMFTFEGKLDGEQLRTSLYDLIIKKWRILGARLVHNPKVFYYIFPSSFGITSTQIYLQTDTLEHHIPHAFDSSTPPCSFEYKTYDTPIDKHLIRPKGLPNDISVQPVPTQNYPFAGIDPKRTFKTYLVDPPPPVLSVYCSVFTDATHIGMTLPHTFNDAKGMSEIMNAWSTCVSHGIDSTAIPNLPLDYNPVGDIATARPPVALPGYRHLSARENLQFVVRVVWDLVRKRKESGRIIHFPAAVLERMKSEAHAELKESLGDNSLSLSKNDILMAWFAKAMFHPDIYTASRDQTPVSIGFAFDPRKRLKSLFPLPYPHNVAAPMCVHPWVTIYEIQSMSLAHLALRIRSSVNESLTEDAVLNHLAWRLKNNQKGGMPFPHNGTYLIASSWRNAGFERVDFSAALCSGPTTSTLTGSGPEDKVETTRAGTRTGRMSMLSPMAVAPFPLRRGFSIPCEDEEGGIWAYVVMPNVDWVKGEFGSLKKLVD